MILEEEFVVVKFDMLFIEVYVKKVEEYEECVVELSVVMEECDNICEAYDKL